MRITIRGVIEPYALLLLGLAVYRLTRLFTIDTLPLVRRPREWLEKKLPEGHWLSELTVCPFCMSGWIAIVLGVLYEYGETPGRWVITWLAVWGVASLAFAALDKD